MTVAGPRTLAALASLAVLAGCGGSGSGDAATGAAPTTATTETTATATATAETTATTAAPERLTREELVERMDAFCRTANAAARKRFGARIDAAAGAGDYATLAELVERRTALFRRQSERVPVEADEVAPGDARPFRRYLALTARMREVELDLAAALRAGDDTEIQRVGRLLEATARRRSRPAAALGLTQCGKPP